MQTITKKIQFFQSCFGEEYSLARDGVNVAFKCPACSKGTNKLKFSINLDTFVCHCWVCDIKGKTPYYIIKKYVSNENSIKFKKAFSIKVSSSESAEIVDEDFIKFPCEFKMFATFINKKILDPDIRDSMNYLNSRGIGEKLMWRHKIGTFVGRRGCVPCWCEN